MKENSKHIPNKIEQNRNNQKSSLNDLRWRGGRLPQRTWTNTREKVARIARICMLPHFKRRTNVNPEKPFSRTQIPRTHVLQTLADPEAAHKVKVRFYQLESISKSLKCSAIRYLSKSVRNFELRRRKECKEFDAEAASKLRLPKQHPPKPALRYWRAKHAA